MTEEGVGALAYSGKLMRASPLPPTVRSVMTFFDEVRPYVVVDGEGGGEGEDAEGGGGGYFDCALYSRFACRFHSDGGGRRSSTFRISSCSDIPFFVVDVVVDVFVGMGQRTSDASATPARRRRW